MGGGIITFTFLAAAAFFASIALSVFAAPSFDFLSSASVLMACCAARSKVLALSCASSALSRASCKMIHEPSQSAVETKLCEGEGDLCCDPQLLVSEPRCKETLLLFVEL